MSSFCHATSKHRHMSAKHNSIMWDNGQGYVRYQSRAHKEMSIITNWQFCLGHTSEGLFTCW